MNMKVKQSSPAKKYKKISNRVQNLENLSSEELKKVKPEAIKSLYYNAAFLIFQMKDSIRDPLLTRIQNVAERHKLLLQNH